MRIDLSNQLVRIGGILGLEVIQLDELGLVDGQLQIENVVAAGEKSGAATLGRVEVGIDGQHHLLVDDQHFRLILGEVGLEVACHLAGKFAGNLVHQFTHDVADVIRGVRAGQFLLRHAHVQHVVLVELHRGLGRKVDDDETGEAPVQQYETADVRFEAGLGDALDHARIVDLAMRRGGQNLAHRIAQDRQDVFSAECGGMVFGGHDFQGVPM